MRGVKKSSISSYLNGNYSKKLLTQFLKKYPNLKEYPNVLVKMVLKKVCSNLRFGDLLKSEIETLFKI